MIEAMWAVQFIVPNNGDFGAGIVVLENGLVRGGDSGYYYIGDYSIKDDIITAKVEVVHYAGPPNNVLGPIEKAHMLITGTIGHAGFTAKAAAKESPHEMYLKFSRIAEISR